MGGAIERRVTGADVGSSVSGSGALRSISRDSAAEPNDGKPSKSISHGPIVSRSPLRAGALVNSLPLSNAPLAQRVTTTDPPSTVTRHCSGLTSGVERQTWHCGLEPSVHLPVVRGTIRCRASPRRRTRSAGPDGRPSTGALRSSGAVSSAILRSVLVRLRNGSGANGRNVVECAVPALTGRLVRRDRQS